MKDHTYEVRIVDNKGTEVSIFGPSKSLWSVRNVAQKQKDRKKPRIYRDNKLLPGGKHGLDQAAYEQWFKDKEN